MAIALEQNRQAARLLTLRCPLITRRLSSAGRGEVDSANLIT
jgi:hypothetical protein